MPRLKHYDNLGTARFITFSCYKRYKYFNNQINIKIFLNHLKIICVTQKINILGYAIMPDHVHLVLLPIIEMKLGKIIGQLKGRTAKEIISVEKNVLRRSNGQPAVWQRRCYDHNCRTREIVIEKINYCHNNPVASGLVHNQNDWKWSSYNWYRNNGEIVMEIDGMKL
ncbi:MAG: transposase [bacterium]